MRVHVRYLFLAMVKKSKYKLCLHCQCQADLNIDSNTAWRHGFIKNNQKEISQQVS